MFRDRIEAGKKLAEKLLAYRDKKSIVLALPRGGVAVGYEVACQTRIDSASCAF